ncbi:uncharacterized protein VICG_00206 [Vittaforma corneae ATCC 50505]|uniref:Anaphase-promoting complex subunit 4 WD40 domain-containing protein n=1 Tax=Vittaforma corneae (strain ATCC 50505) TaxID=993615 RepID=L2GPX5_VITCO|nr:uncharacterized protein VICG_00206 [Vittaforma corneae ATCC 50505]ELA42891.1 hypothetical protein VICG_00206 [Vittaforma corneae ATCC 50505]
MVDLIKKHPPIEVTTHNIYFHEDSPILSMDIHNNMLATCGFDGVVRLWRLLFKKMNYDDNVYKTAVNSTIQIEYLKDLAGFSKPINCVRFCKSNLSCPYLLAACADGGRIILYTDKTEYTMQKDVENDAYDMCWSENLLFVGFGSGRIDCYKIEVMEETSIEPSSMMTDSTACQENANNAVANSMKHVIKSELVFSQNIHENTIQGISYNKKYNLLATYSVDKTLKVHMIHKNKLQLVSQLDQNLDTSRGLFKRILFEEDLLHVFTKNNTLSIFAYPFKPAHLQKRVGPLNSSIVKVVAGRIRNEDALVICTKKSAYVLVHNELDCCVDNACYMAITDAIVDNNTVFLSSMDGFICTIRF